MRGKSQGSPYYISRILDRGFQEDLIKTTTSGSEEPKAIENSYEDVIK